MNEIKIGDKIYIEGEILNIYKGVNPEVFDNQTILNLAQIIHKVDQRVTCSLVPLVICKKVQLVPLVICKKVQDERN